MACIHTETIIDAPAQDVWDGLRDWGALHTRFAPGFVTDTRLEGGDRIVTFFDGTIVREVLVDRDDDARRLSWSIVGGPYSHHNGVAQVFATEDGRTRFVWVTDLLPDEAAERTAEFMKLGAAAARRALESVRA